MPMSICKNIVGIQFISSSDIFLVLTQNEKKEIMYLVFKISAKQSSFFLFVLLLLLLLLCFLSFFFVCLLVGWFFCFLVSAQLKSPLTTLQSYDCHCTNTCKL